MSLGARPGDGPVRRIVPRPSVTFALLLTVAMMIVILVGAIAPAASAALRHGCAARTGACFPKTISGSFSGEDADFTWQGTVALKAHRRQTTYAYLGRARYTWALKRTTNSSGCAFTPASGTISEKVGLSINLTRSGKRGYSYAGGNGAGGGTGEIKRVCPDGTDDAGLNKIEGAFDVGGNTRSLQRLAGSNIGTPYRLQWSFHGGW